MFYKFNNFIGRLMPSTPSEAYSPQGLNPTVREPSRIIFDSQKTRLSFDCPAPLRSGSSQCSPCEPAPVFGVVPAHPRYKRIMELQCHFLRNDGKLVWQKMGTRDTILYGTTLALCVIGGLVMGNMLISMIFPRPPPQQCK